MELLAIICLTHKGLTEIEILKAIKISHQELLRVLNIFKNFTMCYHNYWVCSNEIFRHVIERMYYNKPEIKEAMHKKIAEALEKTSSSVRKLEEQTYHYYSAKDFFTLKQIIATVENFLMLFNPMTKFDLFRYWQDLEKLGYDPVTEYNKGIELFDSHYDPEPDKLFMIILQVCRFLKEFSDFETDYTPAFRHPIIKGKVGVFRKIEDDEEKEDKTKNQNISADKSTIKLKPKGSTESKNGSKLMINNKKGKKRLKYDDPARAEDPFYDEGNELSDIDEKKEKFRDNGDGKTFNYLDTIGLMDELKKFKLTKDKDREEIEYQDNNHNASKQSLMRYEEKNISKRRFQEILDDWEDVNIEVPEGCQRFRDHFVQILEERNAHRERAKQRDEDEMMIVSKQLDDSTEQEETSAKKAVDQSTFHKDDEYFKHKYLSMMDDIDLQIRPEKDPSFYYYKRWIWIIFPWICMSVKEELNFSEVIARCYSSATKYMRIDEEKQFYRGRLLSSSRPRDRHRVQAEEKGYLRKRRR
jgi:hypothetical protein